MDPYSAKVAQHFEAILRELDALRGLPPEAEIHGLARVQATVNVRLADLKKAVKSA